MAGVEVRLPRALLDRARRGPEWADWLHRLPRLIQAIAGEWELEFDGRVLIGETAAVLPAVHGDGERVMAKFGGRTRSRRTSISRCGPGRVRARSGCFGPTLFAGAPARAG